MPVCVAFAEQTENWVPALPCCTWPIQKELQGEKPQFMGVGEWCLSPVLPQNNATVLNIDVQSLASGLADHMLCT